MKYYLTIMFMALATTSVFAQENTSSTPLLDQAVAESNTPVQKKLLGLSFDLGGKISQNEYPYEFKNHRIRFYRSSFGFSLYSLKPRGFLSSIGAKLYGDYRFIGTIGIGGLKTLSQSEDQVFRIGGGLDLRVGYDFGQHSESGLFLSTENGIDNIVVGASPIVYFNANHFLLGLYSGADYSFSKGFSLNTGVKLGFLF